MFSVLYSKYLKNVLKNTCRSYNIETTLCLVVCKYATSWVQQLCKDTTNSIFTEQ